MKCLFLDCDGVLNSHSFCDVAKSCSLKPECVRQFNRIIHETKCKVVLSSAWRYMILGGAMTLDGFAYMLRTHGVTAELEIIGHTVSDEDIPDRGDQIAAFLLGRDDVESWCVLDDMHLAIESGHMVCTDGKVGLTEEHANYAIAILNAKPRRCGFVPPIGTRSMQAGGWA